MSVARTMVLEHGFWVPTDGGTPIPGDGNQDPSPPPPPPGGAGTLLGASISQGIANDFNATEYATAGPWSCARRYQSGNFANTWASDSSGAIVDVGKRVSIYSCKPDLALLVSSATERARLTSFVQSIPDSHPCFLEGWHELDVKYRKNLTSSTAPFSSLSLAQVNAGKLIFYDLVKQAGKPHVYTTLIMSNFAANGATSGTPDQFWVGPTGADRVIDVVGWDIYQVSDTATTGSHEQANPLAFCVKQGAGFGIGELGMHGGAGNVTDFSIMPGWMSAQVAYAAGHNSGGHTGAAYICWFDSSNETALPVPSHDSGCMTESGILSAQYFTPYSTFVL